MTSNYILTGLVLAGGKSIRMGTDKGAIHWYGKEQRYHMADVLAPLCSQVFISCRPDQQQAIDPDYSPLPDSVQVAGPMAGILSAFRQSPGHAWLVTACDLPLLDASTLQFLIANRNPGTIATTFRSPHDGLPEPLITIWEPAAHAVLRSFADKGITCPRKVLLNSNITLLEPPSQEALLNANTPADADRVQEILRQQTSFENAG